MRPNNELIAIESRLRTMCATDPPAAIKRATELLRGAAEAVEKSTFAGVLVDAGSAIGDEQAIRRGVATIKWLVRSDRSHAGYRYMEGTAYLALAGAAGVRTLPGYVATRKLRVSARRALWEAAESTARNAPRAEAWINLGNDLLQAGRWDEAYTCYRKAMVERRDHPVAAGYAASILLTRNSAWSAHGGGWEALAHHFARIAQAGRDVVAVTSDGADKLFEQLPTDRADEVSFPETTEYSGYERYIYRNRLYLAVAPDGEFHPECWDDLTAPTLTEPIDGPVTTPAIIAMFNLCKADYLLARSLGWSASETDVDDGHLYTDTLDYASYGARVAQLVLATRSALDILDRIAVAANHYFAFGIEPSQIKFRDIWREVGSNRLRPRVEEEITAGNFAMLALTGMADDLVGHGWLEGHQRFRNSATHRFVVMHVERVGPENWRSAPEVQHLYEEDLRAELLAALRVARSGILYLHEAVRISEIRRGAGRRAVPLMLPRLI